MPAQLAPVLALVAACLGASPDDAPDIKEKSREVAPAPNLHPKPPEPVPPEELEASIRRGVDFLVGAQRKDGSWGSPALTGVAVIAGIGSHHAFGVATTSLCVSALIEAGDGSEAVTRAIERGEEYLFRELPRVRRDDSMLIYNVWAHGYGLQALAHMHGRRPDDAGRRRRIEDLIRQQYDRLTRYESVEGGWGYYDFGAGTQRPDSSSCCFVSAAILEAIDEAKRAGVAPPEKIVRRALDSIRLQRKPDDSYLYGIYLRTMPVMEINRPGGSLGRTQSCNLALRLWGDETVTDAIVKTWLDRLITRNGWLDMGRKRPIPHESYFMVAGYFYYFGHYYAGRCIGLLPPSDRPFYQDHLARILMKNQEQDGCWWDYPMYSYHREYGTSFALMSLVRCRKP